MSKGRTSSAAPADVYRAHDLIDGAGIWRDGEPFISDLDRGAAKRLAALLNEATDLVDLVANRGGVEHARTKIAFAVAMAMGCKLDLLDTPHTGRPLR